MKLKQIQYTLPLTIEGEQLHIDESMGLVIKGDLTDTQYTEAAHWLQGSTKKLASVKTAFDRWLGQLILHYAATRECTWTDAISRMDLVEETNRAFKSLVKLPRIVSSLPEDVFSLPNITTTHLDAVCSYAGPEDAGLTQKFNDGRIEILKHASEHPGDVTVADINNKMRALQSELGVSPSRKASAHDVKHDFMLASVMMVEWTEEDYKAFGIKESEAREYWQGYRDELISRGILPASSIDPACFCPPWKSNVKIVDVEVAE